MTTESTIKPAPTDRGPTDRGRPQPTRVAIIAAYTVVCQALERLLVKNDELEIVASGTTPAEAVSMVHTRSIDALLLVHTGSAMDELHIIQRVEALGRGTRVLVLSTETSKGNALRMLRAGAHGILEPDTTADEVAKALRLIHHGKIYLTQNLQRACAERYLGVAADKSPEESLTDREYQVLHRLAHGFVNREIADQLGVGVKTIDTHRANLLRKLGLRHNVDLVRFAIRQRIIEP